MGLPSLLNPLNLLPRTGSARPSASNTVKPFRPGQQTASPSPASGSGIVTQPSRNYTPTNMFGRGKAKAWNPTPRRAGLNGFEAKRLGRARQAPPPPKIPTWMRSSVNQPPPPVSPTQISPYRVQGAGPLSGITQQPSRVNPSRISPTSLLGGAGAGGTAAAGASATVGSTVAIGAAVGIGAGEVGRRELVEAGYDGFAYPSNTPSLLRDPLQTARDGARGAAEAWRDFFMPDEGMAPQDMAGQPPPVPLTPSQAAPPFQGGQLAGVQYTVTGTWTLTNDNDPDDVVESTFQAIVYGPISEIGHAEYWANGPKVKSAAAVYATDSRGLRKVYSIGGTGSSSKTLTITSTNVVRTDGQPDTGGNPAAEPEQNPAIPNRQPRQTTGLSLGASPAPSAAPLAMPLFAPAIAPPPVFTPSPSPTESPAPPPAFDPLSRPAAPTKPATRPQTSPRQKPGEPSQPSQDPTPGTPAYPGLPAVSPSPQSSRRTQLRPSNSSSSSPSLSPGSQPTTGAASFPRFTPNEAPSATPTKDGKLEPPATEEEQRQQQQPSPPTTSGNKCKDPCIASLGNKADSANFELKELKKCIAQIKNAVGVSEFPGALPLLAGGTSYNFKNIPEQLIWITRNLDSVAGKWPLETSLYDADGNERQLKLEDQSHAIAEIFAALKIIAEDADDSVNALVRLAAEMIQTKVSVAQGNTIAKANADALGYQKRMVPKQAKLQFSPNIKGLDNKVSNAEMERFFTPSIQNYVGWEFADKRDLLSIALRTLEDGEIARAAHFRPISKSRRTKNTITGDYIKESKKEQQKIRDEAWLKFQSDLKKAGAKFKVKKGIEKNNGFGNAFGKSAK